MGLLTLLSLESHCNLGCTFWHIWQYAEWMNEDRGHGLQLFCALPSIYSVSRHSWLTIRFWHPCLGHTPTLIKIEKSQSRHLEFVICTGLLSVCTKLDIGWDPKETSYHPDTSEYSLSLRNLCQGHRLILLILKNENKRKILRSSEPIVNN